MSQVPLSRSSGGYEKANRLIGHSIVGYQVTRVLGRGGMGVVYEAQHAETGQRVAIKVLSQECSNDADSVRRFLAEAHAASQVEHPGLVRTFHSGQLEDGTAYIAMEFLDGESLRARMDRLARDKELLSVPAVLSLMRQVALALHAVHAVGIVHRDLKPANLILIRDRSEAGGERVKVVDFGIAKLTTDTIGEVSGTTVGRFLGTALYASPEQCQMAGRVGTEADVYALGVTMYELLAGRLPFQATHPGVIISMHLLRAPDPLWKTASWVPAGLCELVHDMLAKDPAKRPDMAQVAERLLHPERPRSRVRMFLRRRSRHALVMVSAGLLGLLSVTLAVVGHRWKRGHRSQPVVVGALLGEKTAVEPVAGGKPSPIAPQQLPSLSAPATQGGPKRGKLRHRQMPPTEATSAAPLVMPVTPPPQAKPTVESALPEPPKPAPPKPSAPKREDRDDAFF